MTTGPRTTKGPGPSPMHQRPEARCAQLPIAEVERLFWPERYYGRHVAQARAICRACPLREACLNFALDNYQMEGLWSATTPDERRTILRRQGRARGPFGKAAA